MKKLPRHHLKKTHHHTYDKGMDPNPPASSTMPTANTSRGKPLLPLAIIAVFLVSAAVGSYYFLYQKRAGGNITPPSSTVASLPTMPAHFLSCPLPESLCQSEDFYSTNIKSSSFSATLKENTPLLAVFDGGIEGFSLSRPAANGKVEEFTLVALNNPGIGYNAMYYLKGKAPKKKFVKVGEVIATANGEPISFLGDKSFVLVITRQDAKGGQMEPISPANFK